MTPMPKPQVVDPPRPGIGLRGPHVHEFMASRPPVGFVEVHTENYLCGGPQRRTLEDARRDYPISLHGVGLSLGSPNISEPHLHRTAELVTAIEPMFVSEHLSWSTAGVHYLNDLLPLPYTDESFAAIARNIDRMQSRLRRRVLIENPSSYLYFSDSIYAEAEFLDALAAWSGCGILCDVNNIYVTCRNLGGDPRAYIDVLAPDAVQEIHVAGHAVVNEGDVVLLIDDHGAPVADAVWQLYAYAARRFPSAATLIEWDSNLPPLSALIAEAETAERRRSLVLREVLHDAA